MARTVAANDLTSNIAVRSRDEIGQLMRALQTMNGNLAATVARIRAGVDNIASASGQIAAGNTDLSSRTEQQAASLEQTAASMEERPNSARQANQLAAAASDTASRGGATVSEVVGAMSAISASSVKIADIVSVIDGIAFQTNILALNAAVEARAGEGQGLRGGRRRGPHAGAAQRAGQGDQGLIEDTVGKIGQGSDSAQRAGATMQDIVASVQRVTDIMGEIAAASAEQADGIEQVNRAVSQMDEVTQQNAALVEEAAAAAGSMQDQAADLKRAVSAFRLPGGGQVVEVEGEASALPQPSALRLSAS